jgi:hypothetical protein
MPDIPKFHEFMGPLLEFLHARGPMARKDQLASDLVGQMRKMDPLHLKALSWTYLPQWATARPSTSAS